MAVVEIHGTLSQPVEGLPSAEPQDGDLRHLPLVLVTWHDAWFDFEQDGDEEPREDYLVRTVGFLVDDGRRVVSVAQELLPDGDGYRAVTHIPRAIIESVETLHEGSVARSQPAG